MQQCMLQTNRNIDSALNRRAVKDKPIQFNMHRCQSRDLYGNNEESLKCLIGHTFLIQVYYYFHPVLFF